MSKAIIAIDPGTTQSAVILWNNGIIAAHFIKPNEEVLRYLKTMDGLMSTLVIEQIRCYGMTVGAETLDTVFWSGRFAQAWAQRGGEFHQKPRMDVKMHLCGTSRAKDANIRQALIDKLGAPGTKKNPGATYGIVADEWQALGLAVTFAEGG